MATSWQLVHGGVCAVFRVSPQLVMTWPWKTDMWAVVSWWWKFLRICGCNKTNEKMFNISMLGGRIVKLSGCRFFFFYYLENVYRIKYVHIILQQTQDADKMLKVVRRAFILYTLFIYPYPFGTKQPQWMSSVELHENININDYFIDIRLMLWN